MTHSSHRAQSKTARAREEVLEPAAEIHHHRVEPALARACGGLENGLGILFVTDPAGKQNHELARRELPALAKAGTLLARDGLEQTGVDAAVVALEDTRSETRRHRAEIRSRRHYSRRERSCHFHRGGEKRLRRPRANRSHLSPDTSAVEVSTGDVPRYSTTGTPNAFPTAVALSDPRPISCDSTTSTERRRRNRYNTERHWNASLPPLSVSTWTRAALSASRSARPLSCRWRRRDRHREVADLRESDDEANVGVTLAEVQHLHAPVTPATRGAAPAPSTRDNPASGFQPADMLNAVRNDRRASATRSKYR